METSICIVSYNARERLRDCLQSLYQYPPDEPFEVIVVDNGSNDDTSGMVRESYPDVKLIRNQTNDGFTKPMNQALKQACGDWLVMLNPDTLLTQPLIQPLLVYMRAQPEIGIVSPKVLNGDGSLQFQCRRGEALPLEVFGYFLRLDRVFPQNKKLSGYLMRWLPEDQIAQVKAVSGSCMLLRREVLNQVGYLDEQLFAFQEDSDYCYRARQAGWQVAYVPLTTIIHYGGEGGSAVHPYKGVWHWHRSYYLYYRKHLAQRYFFLVNWGMYIMMALKLGWAMLITFLRRDKMVGNRKA